ncbi:MAG: hypothetical protein WA446_01050 [Steroidobacteraceae bacterium]
MTPAAQRKAGFIAALCWGGGLVLGGIGVSMHQLWLLWVGAGFLSWAAIGIPFLIGVYIAIQKAAVLF